MYVLKYEDIFSQKDITDKRSCNDPDSILGRLTLGVERLQDVVGEGEGDDCVPSRHDDKEG